MSNNKNKGGRPRKFETPEEMEEKIEEYFDMCENNERNPSMVGLAKHLDITRSVLYEYEGYEGFSDTIKKAREAIEEHWLQKLDSKSAAGAIFMLKNFGWSDKQEHEVTTKEFEVDLDDDQKD